MRGRMKLMAFRAEVMMEKVWAVVFLIYSSAWFVTGSHG